MLLKLFQCLEGIVASLPMGKIARLLLMALCLSTIFFYRNSKVSKIRRQLWNLQKLGLSGSNMTDQFDPKYTAPEDAETNGPIRIKSIYVHPVKSCGPIELRRAQLTKTGFLYDRCFAIACEAPDPDTGELEWRFISQRTKPQMALIRTEIWIPHKHADPKDPLVQSGGCVVISFAEPDTPSWMQRLETVLRRTPEPEVSIVVPLQPTPSQIKDFGINMRKFGIHARQTTGLDMGSISSVAEALPKLKKYLQLPEKRRLTILQCTPDTLTRTDKNLAPLKYIGTPAVHGYTDQQPVNLNSLSSVHAVSALLPAENQPLDALRFRANLWITGAPAFAEESWKRYRIHPRKASGEDRAQVAPKMSVVCRTSRCTMPNVNPATGTFNTDTPQEGKKKGRPQPSSTLIEQRTVEDGNPKALGYIGMHCVPEDQDLEEAREQRAGLYVEVGDEIEVIETGVHLFGSTGNDY